MRGRIFANGAVALFQDVAGRWAMGVFVLREILARSHRPFNVDLKPVPNAEVAEGPEYHDGEDEQYSRHRFPKPFSEGHVAGPL